MDNLVYAVINISGIICVSIAFWITYTTNRLSIIHTLLFSIGWGSSIGLNQILFDGAIRVIPRTLMLLYCVWVLFFIGVLFGQSLNLNINTTKFIIKKNNALSMLVFLILAHITSIILELKSFGAFEMIDPSQLLLSFAKMRVKNEFSDANIAWYMQFFRSGFIMYIPLAIILFKNKIISKSVVISVVLIATFLSIAHFTRAPILNVIITSWISLLLVNFKKVERLLCYGIFILFISVVFFILMESTISFVSKSNTDSVLELVAPYLGGPVKAYETILLDVSPFSRQGFYSLDMFNYILKKVGLILEYPDLVREYVYLPFPTNMYTYLDAFTLDFGTLGALAGTFLIGFVIATFQKNAICGSYFAITIYSLLIYYLVMAPCNNEFIRVSLLIYISIAWLINIIVTKRCYCVTNNI